MFGWSFQFVRPIHCSSTSLMVLKKLHRSPFSLVVYPSIRSPWEARRISEASTAVNMTYFSGSDSPHPSSWTEDKLTKQQSKQDEKIHDYWTIISPCSRSRVQNLIIGHVLQLILTYKPNIFHGPNRDHYKSLKINIHLHCLIPQMGKIPYNSAKQKQPSNQPIFGALLSFWSQESLASLRSMIEFEVVEVICWYHHWKVFLRLAPWCFLWCFKWKKHPPFRILSIESRLFQRDPYNGLSKSPHNWVV